jgi:hypothetical protein
MVLVPHFANPNTAKSKRNCGSPVMFHPSTILSSGGRAVVAFLGRFALADGVSFSISSGARGFSTARLSSNRNWNAAVTSAKFVTDISVTIEQHHTKKESESLKGVLLTIVLFVAVLCFMMKL